MSKIIQTLTDIARVDFFYETVIEDRVFDQNKIRFFEVKDIQNEVAHLLQAINGEIIKKESASNSNYSLRQRESSKTIPLRQRRSTKIELPAQSNLIRWMNLVARLYTTSTSNICVALIDLNGTERMERSVRRKDFGSQHSLFDRSRTFLNVLTYASRTTYGMMVLAERKRMKN